MKPTIINRHWPAEEDADALAEELEQEAERNRTDAAVDLQRTLQDLQLLRERSELTIGANQNVKVAIEALRAAADDQWQAARA